MLLIGETRRHKIPDPAGIVYGIDNAVAGAGQHAGAVHDLLQHGTQIQARTTTKDHFAQARKNAPATP